VTVAAFAAGTASEKVSSAVLAISYAGGRSFAAVGQLHADANSRYRIASLTKAFTAAALVLELHHQGITLETPAIDFLPELDQAWRADRSITVTDLLGQVAGLRESVDAAMAAAAGDGDDALTEVARMVVSAGSDRAPGDRWSYYNGNYFLAGAILARLRSTTFELALHDRLLEPWQLTSSGFDTPNDAVAGWDGSNPLRPSPYPRGRRPSGGLWSTAADLLTFTEHVRAADELLDVTCRRRTQPDDPMSYGLGWALGPSGQLYLNGRLPGYRAVLLLSPRHAFAGAALSSQEEALPLIADAVNRQQLALTGDDLAEAITAFAA
jgi:D-alanyl-D-alanine carboxypeptidase